MLVPPPLFFCAAFTSWTVPLVARGAERGGVEWTPPVGQANPLEFRAAPDVFESARRRIADTTDRVQSAEILIAQGDAPIGKHQTS